MSYLHSCSYTPPSLTICIEKSILATLTAVRELWVQVSERRENWVVVFLALFLGIRAQDLNFLDHRKKMYDAVIYTSRKRSKSRTHQSPLIGHPLHSSTSSQTATPQAQPPKWMTFYNAQSLLPPTAFRKSAEYSTLCWPSTTSQAFKITLRNLDSRELLTHLLICIGNLMHLHSATQEWQQQRQ